jgi:hypothetical protein
LGQYEQDMYVCYVWREERRTYQFISRR